MTTYADPATSSGCRSLHFGDSSQSLWSLSFVLRPSPILSPCVGNCPVSEGAVGYCMGVASRTERPECRFFCVCILPPILENAWCAQLSRLLFSPTDELSVIYSSPHPDVHIEGGGHCGSSCCALMANSSVRFVCSVIASAIHPSEEGFQVRHSPVWPCRTPTSAEDLKKGTQS